MLGSRRRLLVPLLLAGLAAPVQGHPDDPKLQDVGPPYLGPGYRANRGGAAGMAFPASGVTLLSHVPLGELSGYAAGPQSAANDCWGYVSPSGREYAIIGLSSGTGFVEVTNPGDARVVTVEPALESVWRDIKVYGQHAYVVTEASGGIQVFDLGAIDEDVVTLVGTITEGGTLATHNVAIDEASGFLYRCGGGSNGLRIYSLADPAQPQLVGEWTDRYVHDCQVVTYDEGPYAGKQIAFCCTGFNGGFVQPGIDILDVTDKQDVQVIANYQYPGAAYSHQAWLSEDRQVLYLNDELDESQLGITSTTHVIFVGNLETPQELAAYTNGLPSVTHNLYVRDDTIFAANYTSGLRVYDVSSPLAPEEIAYFDTVPDDNGVSTLGLWSNYPFFPSGTVIGSDRQTGLFVLWVGDPALGFSFPGGLPPALHPAGDAIEVEIVEQSGTFLAGSARLVYDVGGEPVEVPLVEQGEGQPLLAVFPETDCDDVVSFFLSARTDNGVVWRDPPQAPAESYALPVASAVEVSFADDFESDAGWTVEDSPGLTDGTWERGVPAGGGDRGDPADDADGSGQCFLTANADGNSDVDGGATTLTSPVFSGVGLGTAVLTYERWYSNNTGDAPFEDSMPIEVSNDGGASWLLLEDVEESAGEWVRRTWQVDEVIEPTEQMRLRFTASDEGLGSVVEAGVDDVALRLFFCQEPGSADVNADGVVDVEDLVLVISGWGACPPPPGPCPADIDGNGQVDVADLVAVITGWGP